MRTAPTAPAAEFVVGQFDASTVLSPELTEFSYAFSGSDRVLGLYGRVETADGRNLVVRDFLACCSRLKKTSSRVELGFFSTCLAEAGWSRDDDCSETTPRWTQGPFSMTLHPTEDAGAPIFHAALSVGKGYQYFERHRSEIVPRHRSLLRESLVAATRRNRPRTISVFDAAASLRESRFAVYSGAGISVRSGVPTFFGHESIDEQLGLQQSFPGDAAAWMCGSPGRLTQLFGVFQASLLNAKPSDAHRLLVKLESTGHVSRVITNNLDTLHDRLMTRRVLAPTEFVARLQAGDVDDIDSLLVLGVSDDVNGLVAQARDKLRIFIADIQQPAFAVDGDSFVQTTADDLLRAVTWSQDPECEDHFRFLRLVDEIERRSTSIRSTIHGPRHWLETAWLGNSLLQLQRRADSAVVLRFALMHDALRDNDGFDPDHGRRAAQMVDDFPLEVLGVSAAQRAVLRTACELHADGLVTTDPTIAVCWDSDRLGLARIGIRPEPVRLSLSHSERRMADPFAAMPSTISWVGMAEEYGRHHPRVAVDGIMPSCPVSV